MLIKILIAALFLTMTAFSQTPPIEPGVSQSLAKWRAANYSDVRYKLNITLEKGAPLMKGTIEISVKMSVPPALAGGSNQMIVLDWRKIKNRESLSTVSNVFINGKSATLAPPANAVGTDLLYEERDEHLIFTDGVKSDENIIKLDFTSPIATSGSAITRYVDKEDDAEYVYSLFVPSDASTAFPVFDQPDLKARFSLAVLLFERSWKVISNAKSSRKIMVECLAGKVCPIGYSFEETKPISTYVFAFAAGDFAEFDGRGDGLSSPAASNKNNAGGQGQAQPLQNAELPMKIYVRKSQAERFKQHAAEVFRLNREGIKFLETYFDYKFPFPKYDLVLIPEFPFGGMEHAGATFLREDRVIFPTEPTKNDYITRANVIFHEAAHQWFGDTVTMRWFDDLWLKEGFAEFMAYKTLEKVMPEYNAWKIFYERNKQAAYLTDSTRGTTPIYQEIENLSAAKSAYGNIVYRKAPSFLRQAEFYLGEDKFQTAVRAFLKKHEFANAEWTDLVKEFETASKQDLKDWANVWVKQPGLGKISVASHKMDSKVGAEFYYLQQNNLINPNEKFSQKIICREQKVKVFVIDENDKHEIFDANTGELEGIRNDDDIQIKSCSQGQFVEPNYKAKFLLTNKPKRKLIFPNYQDYGYGIFLLDEKSRAYVLANIQNEKDDFLRTMMYGALWDSVRETELAPEDYVKLVIKNLALSPDFSRQTAAQKPTAANIRNADEKPPEGGTQNISETDESTISTLLGRVSTAMNYYIESVPSASAGGLTPQGQTSNKNPNAANAKLKPSATADGFDLQTALEKLLINKIETAPTVGQKITYFRALQSLGSGSQTKQLFKDLLNGKSKLKDIGLKTKDKFDLVTRLIILGDKDALNILAELEKQNTDDAAKRYAYAARAGIPTAENKLKYWNDFVGSKEISESYIESAFTIWNSPKHADLTLPYLEKALAELPNLKKNRKIFFVNGWLASFIGGQKSEQALQTINKFLADNPNLDKDLRLKILENADNLERAVKIRAQYQ